MTLIHHFAAKTGEFLGSTEARLDPIDNTPMVPGNATLIEPPAIEEGKARVFKEGAWSQVEDHRGTVYWTEDGSEHVVTDLGPMPEGALSEAPVLPVYPTKETALAAMIAWIDGFLLQITGHVPAFERASWPSKAEAARAFIAGTARPDQHALLDAEVSTSDRSKEELAAVIVENANVYEVIIGQATGLRVMLTNQIEAVTDPFQYEAILEGGKVQAKELAEALGSPQA